MKRVAAYSLKGGVGKTTTAINVAHVAAQAGVRTLLWDLDPQATASHLARIRQHIDGGATRLLSGTDRLGEQVHATAQIGLHVVPADLTLRALDVLLDDTKHPTARLAELLVPLDDRYDICIIDCAAGITLATDAIFAAVDALVVPTIPSALSVRALQQLVEIVRRSSRPPMLMPFVSMIDRRKRIHRDAAATLAADVPELLPTQIPSSIAIERTAITRTPVSIDAPRSASADAYRQLWTDISTRLWAT